MSNAQDPRWREMSASLRKGQLFVKMPVSQAYLLSLALNHALEDCLTKEAEEYLRKDLLEFLIREIEGARSLQHQSIFYQVPSETALKDANLLRDELEAHDHSGIIERFRTTLESGLEDDPRVDWIRRVGGPGPSCDFESLPTPAPFIDFDLE